MLLQSIGDFFTFQTFGDKEKSKHLVKTLHGTLEQHRETLTELNAAGAGVFFTVNETDLEGRTAEHVTRVRALFADFDTVNHSRAFNYFLPPSCVVESSPGKHHAYWLLSDDLPLHEFKSCQLALAELLGSDPKINDLPRVMRVPGFTHQKGEPFRVTELSSCDRSYTAAELKEWIGVDGIPDSTPPAAPIDQKITYTKDDPEAVTQFNELLFDLSVAGDGERNNTLNRAAYQAYGLVRAGRLYKDRVYSALLETAMEIGLSEEEAATTIDSARKKSKPEFSDLQLLPDLPTEPAPKKQHSAVELTLMSDVDQVNPDWLWRDWLCRGVYNQLAGRPGAGKTGIASDIAAIVSRGGKWPDGTSCEPQFVLYFTTEDDYGMTIAPRLAKAGADLSRVATVNSVTIDGKSVYFNPAKHLPLVAQHMQSFEARYGKLGLVIIDPIVSAITGDHNKNEEVRRGMEPVLQLARSTGAAILGITHFGKNGQGKDPNDRIPGSTAFNGIARMGLLAITTQDDEGNEHRILTKGKSNIADSRGGYEYSIDIGPINHIDKISYIKWGAYVELPAHDIVSSADQTGEERSVMAEAKQFLADYLADGPRDAKHGEAQARAIGLSKTSLLRARRDLKIVSRRSGPHGWEWVPPDCNR